VDLQAEPVPEQVCEFGVLGPVEGFNAQQELVVVSGEDGPSECDRGRTHRELAAEHVDARLAELPEWLIIEREDGPGLLMDEATARGAVLSLRSHPRLEEVSDLAQDWRGH